MPKQRIYSVRAPLGYEYFSSRLAAPRSAAHRENGIGAIAIDDALPTLPKDAVLVGRGERAKGTIARRAPQRRGLKWQELGVAALLIYAFAKLVER